MSQKVPKCPKTTYIPSSAATMNYPKLIHNYNLIFWSCHWCAAHMWWPQGHHAVNFQTMFKLPNNWSCCLPPLCMRNEILIENGLVKFWPNFVPTDLSPSRCVLIPRYLFPTSAHPFKWIKTAVFSAIPTLTRNYKANEPPSNPLQSQ